MDAKTLKALEGSILHWNNMAAGCEEVNIGPQYCDLCKNFWSTGSRFCCWGCPVFESTLERFCDDTPYWPAAEAAEALEENSLEYWTVYDIAEEMEQELIFLCSLLPKDHEWYEEYQED